MVISGDSSVVDLLYARGKLIPMPDASSPVTSVLLHRDASTRARTLVVGFPGSFLRTRRGRYRSGEEVLVIAGELSAGDLTLRAGDWAWFPASTIRRHLATSEGATAYAWFSGDAHWEPCVEWEPCDKRASGPSARAEHVGLGPKVRSRTLRGSAPGDGPGRSAIVAPATEIIGPAEMLSLVALTWSRVEPGERILAGPGPAFARWFEPRQARHVLPGGAR